MQALSAAVVPGEYGFICLIPAGSSPSSGNKYGINTYTDGSGSVTSRLICQFDVEVLKSHTYVQCR